MDPRHLLVGWHLPAVARAVLLLVLVLLPGRAAAQFNVFDYDYWPKPEQSPATVEVRLLDDGLRPDVTDYDPNTQVGMASTVSMVAGGALVMAAIKRQGDNAHDGRNRPSSPDAGLGPLAPLLAECEFRRRFREGFSAAVSWEGFGRMPEVVFLDTSTVSDADPGQGGSTGSVLVIFPELVIPERGDRLVVRLWAYLVEPQGRVRKTRMFRVYEWSAVLPDEGKRRSPSADENRARLAALGRERLLERVDHGIAEVVKRLSWDFSSAGREDHAAKHHYDRFRGFGLEIRGRSIQHLPNWGGVYANPYGIVGYEWIPVAGG